MKHDKYLIFLLALHTGKNAEYIKTTAKKLAEDVGIPWKITKGRGKKQRDEKITKEL